MITDTCVAPAFLRFSFGTASSSPYSIVVVVTVSVVLVVCQKKRLLSAGVCTAGCRIAGPGTSRDTALLTRFLSLNSIKTAKDAHSDPPLRSPQLPARRSQSRCAFCRSSAERRRGLLRHNRFPKGFEARTR